MCVCVWGGVRECPGEGVCVCVCVCSSIARYSGGGFIWKSVCVCVVCVSVCLLEDGPQLFPSSKETFPPRKKLLTQTFL